MWQQKAQHIQTSAPGGGQHSDSKTTTVDSWEQASRNATVVQAGAWAVLCSLTQNSKIWEYFSIQKKKNSTKWQQRGPTFKSTYKHQHLVLKLMVLKTLYFIFKQHAPCQEVTFFPLFKQAARVMAWWTNFTSFYSVFSIFNTASSRPDGTNAIASKSIHLAAFLKWQIWWIEPRLLYKAPFQNALPGTCLL